MDAPTSQRVPDEVLDRQDVQRALSEHDFAAAFTLIKQWGGLSQNKIASACQLTPGKISSVVNGQQQITSMDVIRRIADGLRIPGHLVGLTPRPWEAHPTTPSPARLPAGGPSADVARWRPDATIALATHLTRSDLVMNRRDASRSLATAAVTGAALLNSLEGFLQPASTRPRGKRTGRLGRRDIEQLEQTAQAFRRGDHQHGGGLQQKAVLGQLNEVAAALEEHQSELVEKRLYQVMAQLSATVATMVWDAGHQRRAQEYYELALWAAHNGDDTVFGANVLAAMARQMLYQDRPQDALELVRLAQEGTRRLAGPRVRAMLHTREAWAFAAMGRPEAFRRATGQAQDALAEARAEAEPYWISYFGEAELAGVTGGRLLDLARQDAKHAEEAAQEIRTALAMRGTEAARSHALDRIGLAECHFLAGDVRGAATECHLAVEAAHYTGSRRVRLQLGELYPYTVGNSASPPVREARDRIRELLTS